ncbi:helix-turn-helix transcriptional regulator [Idiomarina ramblicola]|uniref:AlpA family transcriptional regulator n=1 Tax=Idiomarina ramblicola TaxID=263724 RepID=A0A432Z191_9GAMM|nr:AlpA family transcriptional regulator [Idiomarina ramblicola]RUO71648.1 AlpA family transcriptional regulator [Idiomarina ramblicola]
MRVIRLNEVKDKIGLSRSTIYRRIANGEFPKPILLGGRASGWIEDEIDEWLMLCINESRGKK